MKRHIILPSLTQCEDPQLQSPTVKDLQEATPYHWGQHQEET